MENEDLVSIIVPVYNVEKYIGKCIDSILSQSYTKFELLLINDGSVDNSGIICDTYAQKDNRIRVFHQVNKGVSSARNLGLEKYVGSYFLFIDSDDYIQSNYLEELMKYKSCDLVQCSLCLVPTGDNYLFADESFKGRKEVQRCLLRYIYPEFTGPVCKLYKSSVQKDNELFFDTYLSSGEDTLWVSQYLLYVDSIRVCSYCGYVYVCYPGDHLSQRGISYEHLVYTLHQLIVSYSNLENKYNIDLTHVHYSVIRYFYHKYIIYISDKNLVALKKGLKESCTNPLIRNVLYDKK